MKTIINNLVKEENRFGSISLLLIITSVLGGVAAGLFLGNLIGLVIIVGVTMATEVMILAGQPMVRITITAGLACIVNLCAIIVGFI